MFLKGPHFMRNGIIISVKAIFLQVNQKEVYLSAHKYEHKDVRESIDYGDTNLSSIDFAE